MKFFLLISVVLLIVLGLLFLFFPKGVIRLNQWGNTVLFRDTFVVQHPKLIGGVILVVGCALLLEGILLL